MLYGLEEGRDHTLLPEGGSIEHIILQRSDDKALNIGNLMALEGYHRKCDKLDYLDKIKRYKKVKILVCEKIC